MDREFVNDGSPAWSVEWAGKVIAAKGDAEDVTRTLQTLRAAAGPVPRQWLGDRLSILWTMFMASRTQVDADTHTVWLSEYLRLLGDLPHDVAALAIDRAVQDARHGFMPSVGEIRLIAEPIVAERKRMIDRLAKLCAPSSGE